MTVFTTSWDDGYALDRKVAEMLTAHGATGTFYLCPKIQHGAQLLGIADATAIARKHELGAHTINHPKLTDVSRSQAGEEIAMSKQWIEQISGAPCTMFCYPYGDWNEEVAAMARDAGFKGARTTDELHFDRGETFAMPTSLHLYPFPWRPTYSRWWHPFDPLGRLRARYSRLREIGIPLSAMGSWLSLAKALFDTAVATNKPVFHLWGHSHEIETYGMWDDLDAFLKHVRDAGVRSVTNGEL